MIKKLLYIIFLFFISTNAESELNTTAVSTDSLIELLNTQLSPDERAKTLFTIASEIYSSNETKAREYLEEGYSISIHYNYNCYLGRYYGTYGNIYYLKYDFIEAIYYYNKSIEYYTTCSNKSQLEYVYNLLGYCYAAIGKYDDALESYQKLLNIYQIRSNVKELITVYNTLGNTYLSMNKLYSALDMYNITLKYAQQINDEQSIAMCYTNLGAICYHLSKHDEALENIYKALDIYHKTNDFTNIATNYANISSIFGDLKNYNIAMKYLDSAFHYIDYVSDPHYKLLMLINKAEICYSLKIYDESYVFFEKALDLCTALNDQGKLPLIQIEMARTLIEGDIDLEKGFLNLNSGFEVAFANKDHFLLHKAYKTYSEYYERKNDYKKALDYFENYIDSKDSVFIQESSSKISNLESKRSIEIKEKDLQITKLNTDKEKNMKIIVFSGSSVMLFVSIILILMFRSRYKINKKLRIQNKQSELINIELSSVNNELSEKNKDISAKKEKIELAHNIIKDDIQKATEYVASLLPKPVNYGGLRVDSIFIPSSSLGGDAYGYYWIDEENFAVFLLDVCGHGVGSALHSVSVLNALQTQGILNVNPLIPSMLLAELNKNFLMEDHDDMFFTIWYGVFNTKSRMLNYASAGHPAPLLIYPDKSTMALGTDNVFIGMDNDSTFVEESIEIVRNSQLYLFSDGVYEFSKKDGVLMVQNDLYKLLHNSIVHSELYTMPAMPSQKDSSLKVIYNNLRQLNVNKSFDDDYSMVKVTF